ncbi:MAG: hypothetical protein LBB53_04935, partial [Prevotellaceae bacterium]|nr:hypothetical protein [Prevotellaceae bacterium]
MTKNTIRKSLTIVFAIAFCANVSAQSIHSVYTNNFSTAGLMSSVMVSNQSGVNYMIGTDTDNNLFVAEMDYSFPTPQPNWVKYFQIPNTAAVACGQVFLKGGVIHPLNGEIFVYGYGATGNAGVFAVITMTNGMPANLAFRRINTAAPDFQITSACWANHPAINPNITVYGIVFGDTFARVLVSSGSPSAIFSKKIPNDYIIGSVAYDADLNNFVVSAYEQVNNKPAIAYIANNAMFNSNAFNGHTLEIIQPNIHLANGTSKVLLEGNEFYYNQNATLIHD